MKNQKAIEEAIKTLITEGRKVYVEEANPTNAECIGQAIASVIDNHEDLLEISATALEDWNAHSEAHVLRSMKTSLFNYDRQKKRAIIDLT